MLIAFNKPYGVLSQFTSDGTEKPTLARFGFPPHVYPIGRLDADSEGLLLLSDEPHWNKRLLHPRQAHPRTYLAQVEGTPSNLALGLLKRGLVIRGYRTRPCQAKILTSDPQLPERIPPIRFRKTVPTAWLEITLTEGKNRQVRRMLAAVGHPCLRLVRVKIGLFFLDGLEVGEWKVLSPAEEDMVLARPTP
ncbi:MAG: pseudouridine synthase [Methylacidiphilales bacterium]|nr:pseudouridine synthase [Candidatus Methylacidiphilales bacterium]MDW8348764.1 pseudouridine synthase [Verrucomicrobiae bacterium]